MTNGIHFEMEKLRNELAAELTGAHAELTTFPSGSAMLDVSRAGRAYVMAFSPAHGFGVDELQPLDGFVASYRFNFATFTPAARQLRALTNAEPPAEAMSPRLSLVVLQCVDIRAAKEFYSTLGFSFVEEQHGTGPLHYAASLGGFVLEIYPCAKDHSPSTLRLGFRVASLDKTVGLLRIRGARILREAKDTPWGRRAIVEDPDGNRVELTPLT